MFEIKTYIIWQRALGINDFEFIIANQDRSGKTQNESTQSK